MKCLTYCFPLFHEETGCDGHSREETGCDGHSRERRDGDQGTAAQFSA